MRLKQMRAPLRARLVIHLKPRCRSIEDRMGYLGAQCEMSYQRLHRPKRDFHFGLVRQIPMFSIRVM